MSRAASLLSALVPLLLVLPPAPLCAQNETRHHTNPIAYPVSGVLPSTLADREEADIAWRDDPNRHMVAVEALVVEINEERTRDLGIRYGFNDIDDGSVVDGGDVSLGQPLDTFRVPMLIRDPQGLTSVGFDDRMPGLGVSLAGMNIGSTVVSARLRALLEQGDAAIRTRPIAVALNNTPVLIQSIDSVPYLDRKEKGDLSVAYENVGVQMRVVPQIKDLRTRLVELDIQNLEVSSVSSFITTQNIDRPVFNKSSTDTGVTLREGETFVVGGLKTRRAVHSEDRVPILGTIPILGALFRSRADLERNMDVLFFITPYILQPGQNFLLPYDFQNQQALGLDVTTSINAR